MVRFEVEKVESAGRVRMMKDGEDGGDLSADLDKSDLLDLVNDLLAVYNQL